MATPAPPKPVGRRSPLDADLIGRFVTALASGVFLKDAAAHVGVSPTTAHGWRSHADDPEPQREHYTREVDYRGAHEHWALCVEFASRTEKAEADAKLASLGRIRQAGAQGTWQADAWYLERKYPAEYGRRVTELTGEGGGPVRVEDTRDRLAAALDRLAEADVIEVQVMGSDEPIRLPANGNGPHP